MLHLSKQCKLKVGIEGLFLLHQSPLIYSDDISTSFTAKGQFSILSIFLLLLQVLSGRRAPRLTCVVYPAFNSLCPQM